MAGCTFRVLATREAAFAREGGVMFVRCRDLGTRCRRLHLLSSWSHSGRSAGCCRLLPAAHNQDVPGSSHRPDRYSRSPRAPVDGRRRSRGAPPHSLRDPLSPPGSGTSQTSGAPHFLRDAQPVELPVALLEPAQRSVASPSSAAEPRHLGCLFSVGVLTGLLPRVGDNSSGSPA